MAEHHADSTVALIAQPPIRVDDFTIVNPSRCDCFYFYCEGTQSDKRNYRYKLVIVDQRTTEGMDFVSAVFIIPAGRESEYIFSSRHGLQSVAASAKCIRLIAVALGRPPHVFESEEQIQSELKEVFQILGQTEKLSPKHKTSATIPVMALNGVGSRNILAEGETDISGRYLIEQVRIENDQHVRRLYFMDNPFVIQSEIVVKLDDNETDADNVVVNKTSVAFEYHKDMVAGLLAFTSVLEKETNNSSGLVIGLGGGGLVNFLQQVLRNVELTVVELDASVVTIAKKYFGLATQRESNSCKTVVRIGNGLSVHSTTDEKDKQQGDTEKSNASDDTISFPPASLNFIIVDVDSKDNTAGMSCPPVSFVETSYLEKLKSLLHHEHGLLAINVSARNPDLFQQVLSKIGSVFENVFVSKEVGIEKEEEQEDFNVVVFCKASNSFHDFPLFAETKSARQIVEGVHDALMATLPQEKEQLTASWLDVEECVSGLSSLVLKDDKKKTATQTSSKKKKGNTSKKKKKGKRK